MRGRGDVPRSRAPAAAGMSGRPSSLPLDGGASGMWHAASSGTGYARAPGGLPACGLIGPHKARISTAKRQIEW